MVQPRALELSSFPKSIERRQSYRAGRRLRKVQPQKSAALAAQSRRAATAAGSVLGFVTNGKEQRRSWRQLRQIGGNDRI